MKPISLRIPIAVSDAYYYMGKLFILTEDRHLKMITHKQIFQKYLYSTDVEKNAFLDKVLFNNDQLYSQYTMRNKRDLREDFNSLWKKSSDKFFEFEINTDDFITICKLPDKEALDFIIYSERAFIGNRDGLYECKMIIEGDKVTAINRKFNKIFDSKSININPRVGRLLVSTKEDGLFAGSMSYSGGVHIEEKPIESQSVRTGWANYDFINYKSSTEANFFINKTEEDNTTEARNFSIEDGSNSNRKITTIGVEQRNLTQKIQNAVADQHIIYSFNSLTKSFVVTEDGKIYHSNLQDDERNGFEYKGYTALKAVNFNINKLGYPLSAYTIGAGGTLYEFFDNVILVKNGYSQQISDIECKQIKTFPSSKWFKNIAMMISESYLEIHSIYPF